VVRRVWVAYLGNGGPYLVTERRMIKMKFGDVPVGGGFTNGSERLVKKAGLGPVLTCPLCQGDVHAETADEQDLGYGHWAKLVAHFCDSEEVCVSIRGLAEHSPLGLLSRKWASGSGMPTRKEADAFAMDAIGVLLHVGLTSVAGEPWLASDLASFHRGLITLRELEENIVVVMREVGVSVVEFLTAEKFTA